MPYRWNPPPGWPPPPAGWQPEKNWWPDPSWGPPPIYWDYWVGDGTLERWQKRLARELRDMAIRAGMQGGPGHQAFQAQRQATAQEATRDIAAEIRNLIALRDEGLITDEQLEAKRRQVLGL